MENASKALIIAGAILLSILIISLGIMVFQNAQGTIQDANLNTQEAQTFNNNIIPYCGNNKSNADMNGLVQAIAASNGAQLNLTDKNYIGLTVNVNGNTSYVTGYTAAITVDDLEDGSGANYPSFSPGITYSASYGTGANGYVNSVTINVGEAQGN